MMILWICCLHFFSLEVLAACRLRKEVHDLTESEWYRLIQAFQRIKEPPPSRPRRAETNDTICLPLCQIERIQSSLENIPVSYERGLLSDQISTLQDQLNESEKDEEQSAGLSSYDQFSWLHRRFRLRTHGFVFLFSLLIKSFVSLF